MSKPETTFYRSVHARLPPTLHHEKMSNPYLGGTWDVWYSGRRDLWVEYKFVVLPKRDTTLVDPGLSSLQLEWGRARLAEGRALAVIVGCKEGGVVLTRGAWSAPLPCADFRRLMKTRAELADWLLGVTGGPV